MDHLERVLDERAGDLATALTEVGFTAAEARRFVVEAGPELVESYEWQAGSLAPEELATPEAAKVLLSGIRGRALATQIGISTEKAWAGLREFVPAVLQASLPARPVAGSESRAGGSGADRDREPDRFDRARASDERHRFSGGSSGWGIGIDRPVFGGLLSTQE